MASYETFGRSNERGRGAQPRRFSRSQMRLNTSEEMISIESLNISLNRTLLLAVGLWPYQQSKLVQFQLVLLFGILATSVVSQLTVFMTSKCNVDLIINGLAFSLCYVIIMIKYSAYKFNIGIIKYSLEQLQHIYDELQDKNEIIIIRKYGSNAKCYTVAIALLYALSASIVILYPFWPRILDILLPTKKSRPYPSPLYMTEYFVDRERYFYLITFHTNAAFCVGLTVMLSMGTITMVIMLHICGMFQIASYRIEHAITSNNMKRHTENKNLIYKRLVYAMDIHRRAMKLTTTLTSRFATIFLFIIVFGVICSTSNLFQFIHEISNGRDPGKLLISCVIIILNFSYLSVSGVIAQGITDHNSNVFIAVYNIRWYTTPLHIQKMILFMLQVGTKPFYIDINGMFQGSLETALSVLSAMISYFTVLYSTRH